jgi:hypothetical protein
MGTDTYIIVPTTSLERAKQAFVEEAATIHVGSDYIALYRGERFRDVRDDPDHWGPEYAAQLPRWMMRGLDPRGLLAIPEVGQAFTEQVPRP